MNETPSVTVGPMTTPERVIIDLLFHFNILCEYQLLALQADVRGFVERMSAATAAIDTTVSKQAGALASLAAILRGRFAAGQGLSPEELSAHAQALDDAARLAADVQPEVYTLIECLSFEDIQSQCLEHLAKSTARLNQGIIERLRNGLEHESVDETRAFAMELARSTRSLYTMPAERAVFDQVFISYFGAKVV